jgi:hypothetical protein
METYCFDEKYKIHIDSRCSVSKNTQNDPEQYDMNSGEKNSLNQNKSGWLSISKRRVHDS